MSLGALEVGHLVRAGQALSAHCARVRNVVIPALSAMRAQGVIGRGGEQSVQQGQDGEQHRAVSIPQTVTHGV
jgi:hypothetical protein